ncbi:MAG: electron transfer flavoprotein subunit alpha/FixB family protein [Clostridiales bacterium]|nr:electron transfer flavoprotein subunit alpha/FixB family protein [Clostridiales bacterium]
MEQKQVIMVVCDSDNRHQNSVDFEMLGKGRELAKARGSTVVALAVGKDPLAYCDDLSRYGAQRILYQQTKDFLTYQSLSNAVETALKKYPAELVLFAGTPLCKAAAATVSARREAGLTADCIDIRVSDEWQYVFYRAAMSSSVVAQIVCIQTTLRICTVKPNVFRPCIRLYSEKTVPYESLPLEDASYFSPLTRVVSSRPFEAEEENGLVNARVVFAVGRGVEKEDLKTVSLIAKQSGAEIGGTRILVEDGLLPKTRQIGQSGLTVAPQLYIALGISGASQHIVGMQNACKVIAVNRDPNAPIFQYADYAIVEDTHEIIENMALQMKGRDQS